MRRRLSYANVVATLALVFAMSGGALAASHYLINSTKQINPKVLKKLKGASGKNGLTGASGASGAPGAAGKEGAQGKEGAKGANGTAVAYAHVSSAGVLDTANSKNVSVASKSGLGIYCLKVTVPVTNVSGMVDIANAGGQFGSVSAVLSGQDPANFIGTLCPAGDNVLVGAEHGAANVDYGFWVNFN
jgi:Collagen triple helix repeat (20 copies)